MSRTDILRHELIGLNAKVVGAENKHLIGINGKIMDETRNMLTIKCCGKLKRLVKGQVILQINYMGHGYEIDGKVLVNRPEDRIKRIRRVR